MYNCILKSSSIFQTPLLSASMITKAVFVKWAEGQQHRAPASAAALNFFSLSPDPAHSPVIANNSRNTHLHSMLHTHINICCCIISQILQPESSGSRALVASYLPVSEKNMAYSPSCHRSPHMQRAQLEGLRLPTSTLLALLHHSAATSINDAVPEWGHCLFYDGILQSTFNLFHIKAGTNWLIQYIQMRFN